MSIYMYTYIYQKLCFLKLCYNVIMLLCFSQSKQNNTFTFQKTVVYILFIKKYDIRKWRQVEFKKGL